MKRARLVLSFSILVVLALLAWRLVDFRALGRLRPVELAPVCAVVVLLTLNRNYVIAIILGARGTRLRILEWLGLGIWTGLVNLAVPFRSGLALKAVYLKRTHGFSYAEFVGTQGAFNLLSLLTFVGFALVLALSFVPRELRMVIPLLATLALLSAPLLLGRMAWEPKSRVLRLFRDSYQVFHSVRSDWKLVIRLVLNALMTLLLTAVSLHLCMQLLDVGGNPLHAVFIVVIATFSNLVSLTPGNFGVQELVGGIASEYLQLDFERGLLAMVLLRAVSIAIQLLMAPLFLGLIPEIRTAREG